MIGNLNEHQFLPVDHLMKFTESNRMTIPARRQHVEMLADSLRTHGYNPADGSAHVQSQGYRELGFKPVTLVHADRGSFIDDGNHRVHAANLAGLSHLPVRVKDNRTDKSGEPQRAAWLS